MNTESPAARLCLVFLLAAGATHCLAQSAPPKEFVMESPGVRVRLSEEHGFQPRNVRFTLGQSPLSPKVESVDFLPEKKVVAVTCEAYPKVQPRRCVTTADLTRLGQRVLATVISEDKPEVHFALRAPLDESGQLVLRLRGVDRLVSESPNGLFFGPTVPGQELTEVPQRTLICQSSRTQHGLAISFSRRDTTRNIRVVSTKTGVELRLPWKSIAPAGRDAVLVTVRAFRGDALIALEEARGAGAPTSKRAVPGASTQPARLEWRAPALVPTPPKKTYPSDWRFLAGTHRLLKPMLADPRDANTRLSFLYGRNANKFMDGSVGGDVVLVERDLAKEEKLALSFRGLFSVRLNTCQGSAPVQNTDYQVGFAGAYQHGDDVFEAYFHHQSSHLGDEVLEDGERARINYSRETVRVLWSHQFRDFRVYVGPSLNVTGEPKDIRRRLTLQAGGDYDFRLPRIPRPMYLAADVTSREETDWDLNFTGQIGVYLHDPKEDRHRPRIFLEFFNGFSHMGQFFDDRETYILIGAGYNF